MKLAYYLMLLSAIITAVFLINGLASAIDQPAADSIIKQNTLFDIKRPCFNNGTYCSPSTVCDISVVASDNTILLSNVRMGNLTSNYPNWNATLIPSKTLVLGLAKADMTCNDNGRSGSDTFYLLITPSGNNNVLGLYIILIGLVYTISFFGFFGKNVWVAIMGGLAMMILGLFTLNNGIDIYRNFMTEAISFITIGLGAIFALMAGVELVQENY